MKSNKFHNPVIKGGYPDPSICRVGDTYYMVTSSFSYFPGLPVFKSLDLIHWEQIGNAVSRPEQLDFRDCDSSEGLWAATIRYDKGTFYIVNTLDVNGRANRYNFILTAKDPAGEWSDAVIIEGADGIDPSLYFDEEGKMWYCGNMIPDDPKYPAHRMIYLCELDRETFQFIGERRIIYDGNADLSQYMEGPHIYRIDGVYYLLTACGGTQTNHCVNIARSGSLLGPYEPCPRNPVVTNRNLRLINQLGVAVTGHGDLVQTQNGEWYMALLGIRPYEHEIEDYECFQPRKWIRTPDRNKNAQFNLGREVFLIPIAWDYDGWLLADNHNGMVNLEERKPDLPSYRPPLHSRVDNFEEDKLDMIWCMRRPVKEPFYSLKERPGYLRMKLLPVPAEDVQTPAMLVRRQQHYNFQAAIAMEFEPRKNGEEAGMIVTQNERFSLLLLKRMTEGKTIIGCYKVVNGVRKLIRSVEAEAGRVYLFIEGGEGVYDFYYGRSERHMEPLALGEDGSILSTVVADGFIGSYLGMYASSCGEESDNFADFDWFRYEIIEE
ncbi:glycoside hydrolase family 43 protein [Clostridium sp. chh4-2]|uniref:glycoside hydrolase family 43 protein n=1 Tax=Clostridium sp. chh4-2 TaxID=2067550 RepID=UPI000CCFAEDC|nr:glycoside hydrolase family 43 protein [Clostridium sp. chh4-2]PNV61823.1 glycoside hydrolase family 43 protein [Clostridium sp. chh4-2]